MDILGARASSPAFDRKAGEDARDPKLKGRRHGDASPRLRGRAYSPLLPAATASKLAR